MHVNYTLTKQEYSIMQQPVLYRNVSKAILYYLTQLITLPHFSAAPPHPASPEKVRPC